MKKKICLILAIALVFGMTACGKKKAPGTEPTTEVTTEATTEATTEPTTEATTEPTTEPTTEATTEPTTAPTTPSEPEYETGKITARTTVNVRNAPGMNGTIVGFKSKGETVKVYERKTVSGVKWGKISYTDEWWVCLDYVSFDEGNGSSTKPTTATEPTTVPTTEPTQATAPTAPVVKPTEPTKPSEPVVTPTKPVTPTQPTTPAPTQPAHVHTWTTVHHDEVGHYEDVVIQEAYDEQVGKGQEVCNACGARFGDATSVGMHIFDVHEGNSGYHHESWYETIHHDAVTEKRYIVDTAAYDEKVCSECGAKG